MGAGKHLRVSPITLKIQFKTAQEAENFFETVREQFNMVPTAASDKAAKIKALATTTGLTIEEATAAIEAAINKKKGVASSSTAASSSAAASSAANDDEVEEEDEDEEDEEDEEEELEKLHDLIGFVPGDK